MLRHRDRYGRWNSERSNGEAWSLARARSLGFGDVLTLEDLRCACHAVLLRPPYEHPWEHPFRNARPVAEEGELAV